MNKSSSLPYLFIASILSAIGLYIFYIKYRLDHFHPNIDLSPFIPIYSSYFRPEIEIELYITGGLMVILGGLVLFFILKSFLQKYTYSIQSSCLSLFVKSIIFLGGIEIYLLGVKGLSRSIESVFLIYLLTFAFLIFIFFFISSRLFKIFFFIDIIYDLLIIVFVYGLSIFLLDQLLLSTNSSISNLISLFRNDSYIYFNGFSGWQLLAVGLILAILLFLWFKPTKVLINLSRSRMIRYLVDILVIIGIIYFVSVIINWRNGYNYGFAPYFDYQEVVGPINDVIGGKTLLVNIHSQYGLLMIYTLALVFKIIPLSYNNFFWVNYAVTIAGVILLYFIMRKWLKSIFLPILGIFLISQHHYFAQNINILFFGQLTFLRFGMWIPLLLYILIKDDLKINSRVKSVIELFLVGVASYWGFDVGLYVLGAYLAFVTVKEFVGGKVDKRVIRDVCLSYIPVGVTLITFFLIISIYSLVRSGIWPNWVNYSGITGQFVNGWGMLPMPPIGPYILFIMLYLGGMAYIIYHLFIQPIERDKDKEFDITILSYVIVYGAMQFLYYVGRSTENNLHIVIIPFMLLFGWVFGKLKNFINSGRLEIINIRQLLIFTGFGILFIISFSTITTVGLINSYNSYLRRGKLSSQTDEIPFSEKVAKSISWINKMLDNQTQRRIALISSDDTFILMKTKSVNIIDSNNINNFFLKSQLRELGKQLLEKRPVFVYMDNSIDDFWNMQVAGLKRYVLQKYHFKENIGYLDIWERN